MKAVCSSCQRMIEVTTVKVVGDTGFLRCPTCGFESSLRITTDELPMTSRQTPGPRALVLASSREASNVVTLRAPMGAAIDSARRFADNHPFDVPEGLCPKCISKRDDTALACKTCGLLFANAAAEALLPPDELATEWCELLRNWGDERGHAAIRQASVARDQLPALARLYRLRLAAMPEDPIAQRGRDEVLAAASSVMTPRPNTGEQAQAPLAVRVFVGGVAVFIILAALVMIRRLFSTE
jgi:transcription elongation factor Elf1